MACEETPVTPIKVDQGDTKTISIVIDVADGMAFDANTSIGVFLVAPSAASADADVMFRKATDAVPPTANFSTSSGVVSLNVPLAQTDTGGRAAGKYYYEALLIEAGGVRSHIARGPFIVGEVVEND